MQANAETDMAGRRMMRTMGLPIWILSYGKVWRAMLALALMLFWERISLTVLGPHQLYVS